jgi:putative DNA primase/helicase
MELDKKLSTMLIEGARMVSLDNLSSDVKSDILNQMITKTNIKVRDFGKLRNVTSSWNGVLLANGNNIALVGDTVRRQLIANLDRKMETPENYKYKKIFEDLIAEIHRNRNDELYYAAVMTIAEAYLAHIKKNKRIDCVPLNGFNGWSKFCREPVIWIGKIERLERTLEDPVNSQEQARRDDPMRRQDFALFAALRRNDRITGFLANEVYQDGTKLLPGGTNGELNDPELNELLFARCESRGKISTRMIGNWLSGLVGQPRGDYKLELEKKDIHGNRYTLVSHTEADANGEDIKFAANAEGTDT